ncbi:hypothetical protein ACOME3_005563 [Neoechinorhynchus agilis]
MATAEPQKPKTGGPSMKRRSRAKLLKKVVRHRERPLRRAMRAHREIQQGKYSHRRRKFRTRIRFRQPKVLELPRAPKCPRKAVHRRDKMDKFAVIDRPLATESAMKKIEENNTLVFIVHKRANKPMIKAAVKRLYEVHVQKVNTLIRPDGLKKAYVKLKVDHDALDLANRIGMV